MNKKFMGDFDQPGVSRAGESPADVAVVHVVGENINGVQRCKRCGAILVNNHGSKSQGLEVGKALTIQGSKRTLGAEPGAQPCQPGTVPADKS